jgi:hypothetical protein
MKEHPNRVLKSFPRTWYFPKWHLVTWHPLGVLDDTLADQIVAFVEMEELIQAAAFDRYVDLSGLTDVRLEAGHVFNIAKRRYRARDKVKSAFWTDKIVTISLTYMFETFMTGARINVRAFTKQEDAAEWLQVPIEILSEFSDS